MKLTCVVCACGMWCTELTSNNDVSDRHQAVLFSLLRGDSFMNAWISSYGSTVHLCARRSAVSFAQDNNCFGAGSCFPGSQLAAIPNSAPDFMRRNVLWCFQALRQDSLQKNVQFALTFINNMHNANCKQFHEINIVCANLMRTTVFKRTAINSRETLSHVIAKTDFWNTVPEILSSEGGVSVLNMRCEAWIYCYKPINARNTSPIPSRYSGMTKEHKDFSILCTDMSWQSQSQKTCMPYFLWACDILVLVVIFFAPNLGSWRSTCRILPRLMLRNELWYQFHFICAMTYVTLSERSTNTTFHSPNPHLLSRSTESNIGKSQRSHSSLSGAHLDYVCNSWAQVSVNIRAQSQTPKLKNSRGNIWVWDPESGHSLWFPVVFVPVAHDCEQRSQHVYGSLSRRWLTRPFVSRATSWTRFFEVIQTKVKYWSVSFEVTWMLQFMCIHLYSRAQTYMFACTKGNCEILCTCESP